ncbi:hypothetical protein EB001_16275 [bacterium]|jgi:hypothetical protein|nr:hypothetical protein [bacterium]
MDKATSIGSNISYTLKVCAAISAVGILIKYGLNTNTASVVGLGLVGLSLFGAMLMVLKFYYSTGSGSSFFSGAVLPSLIQLILICVVVGALIYQTISTNAESITSTEYDTFTGISTALTLMQIAITFSYLFLNMKCLNGGVCTMSERDKIIGIAMMYSNAVLTLLNFCALGIIQVILTKFYIC